MAGQLVRVADVVWRRTSRHVVAAQDRDTIVEIGDLGAVVWDALSSPVEASTLAQELADAFGVPVEHATDRLDAVVAELVAAGLVHRR